MNKTALLVLFLMISMLVSAQDSSHSVETTPDSISYEDYNSDYLFIGLSYNSNNTKNQNFKDTNIPSLIGDVSFYHKSGLWSSILYTNFINEESTYDVEWQLGYQQSIFNGFDLDFYYGWRNFNGNTDYESIDYKHTLNLTSNFYYDFLNLTVENYIYFGSSTNYFLDIDLGLDLDVENFIATNDLLNFSPSVSFSFGNDFWIYDQMTPLHKRTVINFLTRRAFKTNTFEFQSTNFFLPVMYSYDQFTIAFSWMYSVPSSKFKVLNWEDQNAFLISVIFSPNL